MFVKRQQNWKVLDIENKVLSLRRFGSFSGKGMDERVILGGG